jgi:hypothetical protein
VDQAEQQKDPFDEVPGPALTLRVSRDGGRTWGPTVTYQPSRKDTPFDLAGRFPPCRCPRCVRRG